MQRGPYTRVGEVCVCSAGCDTLQGRGGKRGKGEVGEVWDVRCGKGRGK